MIIDSDSAKHLRILKEDHRIRYILKIIFQTLKVFFKDRIKSLTRSRDDVQHNGGLSCQRLFRSSNNSSDIK